MIARADSAFRDDGRHHGFLLSLERCEYAIGTVFDVIMNGASFAGPPLVGLRRTRSAHLALLWQITHAAVRCRATFDSADIAEDLVE